MKNTQRKSLRYRTRRKRRSRRRRTRGAGWRDKARRKSRRAKHKIKKAALRKAAQATAFLVFVSGLQLAGAAQAELSRPHIDEVWVLGCTGNTCRTPALKVAAGEQGYEVETCGTAPRDVGQPATPALVATLKGDSRVAAQEHVSQACEPLVCNGLFNNHDRKVFGVVAEKNAADLRKIATECGVTNLRVRVLGDVAPACKPLENDPFFKSQKHVCKNIKDGTPRQCTFQEIAEENIAYRTMVDVARNCISELLQMSKQGTGPKLGRRTRKHASRHKPRRGQHESELASTTTGKAAYLRRIHRRGEIGEGAVRPPPPPKKQYQSTRNPKYHNLFGPRQHHGF